MGMAERTDLRAGMGGPRAEMEGLRADIADFEAHIKHLLRFQLIWLTGLTIAAIGVVGLLGWLLS